MTHHLPYISIILNNMTISFLITAIGSIVFIISGIIIIMKHEPNKPLVSFVGVALLLVGVLLLPYVVVTINELLGYPIK